MNAVLAVAAGGALGAVARHLSVLACGRLWGQAFPWGTVLVNLLGSLLMGVLVGGISHYAEQHAAFGPTARALLVVGFLGSFTTFSTFSLDAVKLAERGQWWPAVAYLGGSMLLGLLACLLGLRLWR